MKTALIGLASCIHFLLLKQFKRLNWNLNRNHDCKSYLIEKVTLFHLIASKTPFTNMIFFTQSIFEKFHFSNCKLTFDQPKERESSFQNKPKTIFQNWNKKQKDDRRQVSSVSGKCPFQRKLTPYAFAASYSYYNKTVTQQRPCTSIISSQTPLSLSLYLSLSLSATNQRIVIQQKIFFHTFSFLRLLLWNN